MSEVDLSGLKRVVAERLGPFVEKLVSDWGDDLTHVFVVGSATTPDFDEKTSDINTLVVLKEIHFKQLSTLAGMGTKFGRKGITAPMPFTREEIARSLDVFPVEFLTFKLHHQCIRGDDFIEELEIGRPELRLQCERELRRAQVRLGQDYLRALNSRKLLGMLLRATYSSVLPMLTAVLVLKDQEPPPERVDLVAAAARAVEVDSEPLQELERLRRGQIKPDVEELTAMCERTHAALAKLTEVIDALKV